MVKTQNSQNVLIRLGENAKENMQLISEASSHHIWLHLDAFPSGHCIIETSFQITLSSLTEDHNSLIQDAGNFCLQHTKFKNMKHIKVSVTYVSNLKMTDKIGEVEFNSNRRVFRFQLTNKK